MITIRQEVGPSVHQLVPRSIWHRYCCRQSTFRGNAQDAAVKARDEKESLHRGSKFLQDRGRPRRSALHRRAPGEFHLRKRLSSAYQRRDMLVAVRAAWSVKAPEQRTTVLMLDFPFQAQLASAIA